MYQIGDTVTPEKDGVFASDLYTWLADNNAHIEYGGPLTGEKTYTIVSNDSPQHRAMLIAELKSKLSNTDYQAIKFSEGAMTEEEFAPIRRQRAEWRARINELEGME